MVVILAPYLFIQLFKYRYEEVTSHQKVKRYWKFTKPICTATNTKYTMHNKYKKQRGIGNPPPLFVQLSVSNPAMTLWNVGAEGVKREWMVWSTSLLVRCTTSMNSGCLKVCLYKSGTVQQCKGWLTPELTNRKIHAKIQIHAKYKCMEKQFACRSVGQCNSVKGDWPMNH